MQRVSVLEFLNGQLSKKQSNWDWNQNDAPFCTSEEAFKWVDEWWYDMIWVLLDPNTNSNIYGAKSDIAQ